MDLTFGEEKVMLGGGIDMRDAHLVAIDIYWRIESVEVNLAVNLRKRFFCDGIRKVTLEIKQTACGKKQGEDKNSDQHTNCDFPHISSKVRFFITAQLKGDAHRPVDASPLL